MRKKIYLYSLCALLFVSITPIVAQTKKTPRKKTTQTTVKPTPTTKNTPVETTPTPTKKNERTDVSSDEPVAKKNRKADDKNEKNNQTKKVYPYTYEFSQPEFYVSHVLIEHDDNGQGKITFERPNLGTEPITDPLNISPTALERIKKLYAELNFLDSTENYQSEKQFPHLGNMKIVMRKDGGERTAEFNWTNNKAANDLTHEYKKLTEQFIWLFDINLARENQPLESPKLMELMETLIKRNEISDLNQILPLLKDLSTDERLPLIARNRAEKIIKQIEKQREKEKEK